MITGRNRVASSPRIRRHTSYPFIPAIWMSRSTRSGGSFESSSSACGPEFADVTA